MCKIGFIQLESDQIQCPNSKIKGSGLTWKWKQREGCRRGHNSDSGKSYILTTP